MQNSLFYNLHMSTYKWKQKHWKKDNILATLAREQQHREEKMF